MAAIAFENAKTKSQVLAIQYKELSRTPRKFGDHVERNSSQIGAMLGRIITREATIPNGTKEGAPVFMARLPEGKIVMNLGEWLVLENEKFKVYKPDEFNATFHRLD